MDRPPHAHHAGCGCDPKEIQRGNEYSLFKHIDVEKVRCLNEASPKTGARVFRPYDLRHDNTKFVDSADDEQLLFYVPFTGSVKLKSLIVIGGNERNSPSHVQVFINRDDIDFSNVNDLKKVMAQEFDLGYDARGELEHQTKLTKFGNVNSVTLFFDRNHGAPRTRICWIGFKGDFTPMNRAPVIAQYELRPQPADHKTEAHVGGRMGL